VKRRHLLSGIAAAGVLAITLSGCAGSRTGGGGGGGGGEGGAPEEGGTVGVSMPTQESERWIADGDNVQAQLEELGYDVDLQFANNDIPTQVSQIENMISSGARALIIAAIDGTTLTDVLQQAADQDISVISYDRLIRGSENVDYYTTFDNEEVGRQQATSLLTGLGLLDENGEETGEEGPFNIELFAGSPDDNNAGFFFQGAWDVLQPYVESGQLVIPSGKLSATNDDWKSIGILGWGSDDAQAEMDNRLQSFYTGGQKVEVVLSPNDSLALGIEASLKAAGYAPGVDWPIITGQDADKANVQAILNDEQSMTVWKDTRELGERVFEMVKSLQAGDEPEVNDTETYDNGVKVVPSYLLESEIVTIDNYEEVLVDSGYYEESDLQ